MFNYFIDYLNNSWKEIVMELHGKCVQHDIVEWEPAHSLKLEKTIIIQRCDKITSVLNYEIACLFLKISKEFHILVSFILFRTLFYNELTKSTVLYVIESILGPISKLTIRSHRLKLNSVRKSDKKLTILIRLEKLKYGIRLWCMDALWVL